MSRTVFHELLEISEIRKVYFIDDYLENQLNQEAVLVQAQLKLTGGEESQLKEKLQEKINLERVPTEEIVNEIRKFLERASEEERKTILGLIVSISDDKYLSETKTTSKIVSHFPSEVAEEVHPSNWDKIKNTILAEEIKKGGRILILFDHDLSRATGFEARNGIDLIKELKQEAFFDKIDCILISHDIVDAKAELPRRKELINGKDLTESDFFPLSKKRLDVENHFFDGIKKALINRYFEEIKIHTVELIEHSYTEAVKAIKAFDTYDFDDTILKSSLKEGVWAPETILRISDIVFERELKRRMVDTKYAIKFNKEFNESLKFANIQFQVNEEEMQPYSDKLRLRHDETYDPGDIINPLRKPLENGDIFQLGDVKFILVAQACDMMVRGSGKKEGVRNARIATLLKISTQAYKDYLKKKEKTDNYLRDKHPLPYFVSGKDEIGVVDFTDYLIVDVDLLDLCVLNDNGECRISLNDKMGIDSLSAAWKSRIEILIQKLRPYEQRIRLYKRLTKPNRIQRFKDSVEKFIPRFFLKKVQVVNGRQSYEIENQLYPRIVLASAPGILDKDPTTVLRSDSFDFKFKRISKYKDYGATYLLEKFTRHQSRIAEPHDFALSK